MRKDRQNLKARGNILLASSDAEHFDSANHASEALKKLATDSYDALLLDMCSGPSCAIALGRSNKQSKITDTMPILDLRFAGLTCDEALNLGRYSAID